MNSCKNILFVDDKPIFGGGQKVVLTYINQLKEQYNCTIIRPKLAPEYDSLYEDCKLYKIKFPEYPKKLSSKFVQLKTMPKVILTIFKILNIIRKEKPDYLVATTLYALIPLIPLTKLLKIPVIFVIQNNSLPTNSYSNFLIRNCKALIGVSEKTVKPFKNFTHQKHYIIHNSTCAKTINKTPINEDFIKKYDLTEKKVFGYLGRLSQEKNLPNLIKAFIEFHSRYKDSILILVGSGEEKVALENLIAGNKASEYIKLHGYSNSPISILKCFNILCLTSLEEAAPLVIAEAFLAKIPVIGTNVNGINNFVSHQQTGFLASGTTSEAIFSSMLDVYKSNKIETITSNAYDFAEKNFSEAKQKKELNNCFNEILTHP